MKKLNRTLILASQSPRRSEILKKAGYQFVPFPVYVSEIPDKNLSLNEQILDIARRKAEAVRTRLHDEGLSYPHHVVLTADTLVCLDNQTLGKPETEQMAFDFLKALSGRSHEVKTGIVLLDLDSNLNSDEVVSHIETTVVHFRSLTDSEILDYIASKEPLDKAGAYAIQGEGGKFVTHYDGDFNNVVGLPLQALEKLFTLNSWEFLRQPPAL
ncbi:Maf family protein [Pseudobdellovibrio exovorus]|uniref:dTTP/UTP pyrophosphatase n=1 Tax=Pseudobdellovibrio exovorus JSS TaxID=1184267 RepID=M4VNQ9_9BACT|nr:Maf family protein [Pseudobdellovibrio exovorus]AGH94749.1 maf protein [Pseudobdellovibrio exovorus JSS]